MTSLYPKRSLSQRKLGKVQRDIINEKYVNIETGEILDLYSEKHKPNKLRRSYHTFNVLNREMKNLYKTLGPAYYGHLIILIQNMKSDNSIDYDILDVSSQTLKTIKKVYKDENIIQKGKLGNSMKYYVNPDISTYGEIYEPSLLELFKGNQ